MRVNLYCYREYLNFICGSFRHSPFQRKNSIPVGADQKCAATHADPSLCCSHATDKFSHYVANDRVPTRSGNHEKPGKSLKKVPCMEKSWNLKKKNP